MANPDSTARPRLTLYCGTSPLATVIQEDCELVTITGRYELLSEARREGANRAALAWHDRCIERAQRRNRGQADPGEAPPEELGPWFFVDASGVRLPVSCPHFLSRGKLVWRWAS